MPEPDYDKLAESFGGVNRTDKDRFDVLAETYGGGAQEGMPAGITPVPDVRMKHAANMAAEAKVFGGAKAGTERDAALVRGAGGFASMIPFVGPFLAGGADLAAQTIEMAGGQRQTYNPLRTAVEAGSSLIPGVKAAGVIKSASRPVINAAKVGGVRALEGAVRGAGTTAATSLSELRMPTVGEVGYGALGGGLLGGAVGGAMSGKEIAAARSARHATNSVNHLAAGLGITDDMRSLEAIEKSVPILRSMSGTKRPFKGSRSFATFVRGSADKYFNTHHDDLRAGMKGVNIMVGDEAMSLERGLAERARMNKRLNRYDSMDPKTKGIMEETNPKIKDDIAYRQSLRDSINSAFDTAAPQSASQAEIMRNYSHLQRLAEMAEEQANKLEVGRRVAAGSKPALSTLAADTAIQAATGTLAGRPLKWTAASRAKAARMAAGGTAADPEMLFRRASRRFQYIKPTETIKPVPIREQGLGVEITQPSGAVTRGPQETVMRSVGAKEAAAARAARQSSLAEQGLSPEDIELRMRTEAFPTEGQGRLPFVPQQVGGIGGQLPHQYDPLQSQIRMPPDLRMQGVQQAKPPVTSAEAATIRSARQASLLEQGYSPDEVATMMQREAMPTAGQEFFPFVAPEVGGVPQSVGGFQGQRGLFSSNPIYDKPDPRAELLRNFGGQIRTGPPQITSVPSVPKIQAGLPAGVTPKGSSWMGTLYDVMLPDGTVTTIVANDHATLLQKIAAIRGQP